MSSTSRTKRSHIRSKGVDSGVGGRVPRRNAVSALEAHLGYWLRFVSNHVSHAFKMKVERHGVTVAEWVIMRTLFDEDGIKPSEVSAKIGLTRGAVSKLLDRLESKGLVVVRRDAVDRRAQVITLSDAGRRLLPRLAALADANDLESFGHLSAEQRSMLLAVFKSIVDRLGLKGTPVD